MRWYWNKSGLFKIKKTNKQTKMTRRNTMQSLFLLFSLIKKQTSALDNIPTLISCKLRADQYDLCYIFIVSPCTSVKPTTDWGCIQQPKREDQKRYKKYLAFLPSSWTLLPVWTEMLQQLDPQIHYTLIALCLPQWLFTEDHQRFNKAPITKGRGWTNTRPILHCVSS